MGAGKQGAREHGSEHGNGGRAGQRRVEAGPDRAAWQVCMASGQTSRDGYQLGQLSTKPIFLARLQARQGLCPRQVS